MKHRSIKFVQKPLAAAIATSLIIGAGGVASAQDNSLALEEIVVTATRRAQSVTEVPYNITAVSGDDLERAGISDLAGVMKSIPGIVYSDMGDRANAMNSGIVLRGLNTQAQPLGSPLPNLTVPTVSTYMDDTPLTMNLKLTDIERVEVLRGPQGTLYGSGSLGGTIRFIHNKPSVDGFEGSVSTSVEFPGGSDDQSYNVDAVLNMPLSSNFAVRIAGTWQDRAGIIDAQNVQVLDSNGVAVLADPNNYLFSPALLTSVKDTGSSESYGVRVSALWQASDAVDVTFVHHRQNIEALGGNFRTIGSTDYQVDNPFVNQFDQDVSLSSLEIDADLGFATLTSSTSTSEVEHQQLRDITVVGNFLDGIPQYFLLPPYLTAYGYGSMTQGCLFYGCNPRGLYLGDEPAEREDFTQELRLVSNGEGSVDWLVGAYYSDQDASSIITQEIPGWAEWANTPRSGNAALNAFLDLPAGYLDSAGAQYVLGTDWLGPAGISVPVAGVPQFFNDRKTKFKDTSVYGEVTIHATDAWQITAGARFFDQEYSSRLISIFTGCGVSCSSDGVDPRGFSDSSSSTSESGSIFKANTSFQFSDDHNVYLTWAEGFRHGGANALPLGFDNITAEIIPYLADETTNIEIGLKGRLMNDQLEYTIAAYQIDWKNPQMDTFVSLALLPAVVNAEEAESRGVELALDGNLTESLSFGIGYTYTDAELTKDFSRGGGAITGTAGSKLPGVAEHQANFNIDYYKPDLISDFGLSLRLDGQYKGDAENDLTTGFSPGVLKSYSILNTSMGLQNDNWGVTVFINNLLDEKNAITSFTQAVGFSTESAERPRSYGLRVRYDF